MSNPQSVIALCTCLLGLAGCEASDIDNLIANLRGDVQELKHERTDLMGQLSSMEISGDATEAELEAIRARLSELALGIGDGVSELPEPPQPIPDVSQPPSAEEPSGPGFNEWGYTGPEPCTESVFRSLTCDQGEWHWLNPDMSWAT